MWTYLAKFLAYNVIGLKNYTTKTPVSGNWFRCILLAMDLGRTLFFTQILVSKTYLKSFEKERHIDFTLMCYNRAKNETSKGFITQ